MEEIDVKELVEGKPIFESKGKSRLKVTRINKKGEIEVQSLVFPIRSTGVAELIDTFTSKAPQPPVINRLIKPDTDIGREMKLARKQWVKMLDFTDPKYLEVKEKHDQDLGLAIMLQGMDMEIKDSKGVVVENGDRKVEILKGLQMTGEHFTQLVQDIQSLTKWDEEREDNFLE